MIADEKTTHIEIPSSILIEIAEAIMAAEEVMRRKTFEATREAAARLADENEQFHRVEAEAARAEKDPVAAAVHDEAWRCANGCAYKIRGLKLEDLEK